MAHYQVSHTTSGGNRIQSHRPSLKVSGGVNISRLPIVAPPRQVGIEASPIVYHQKRAVVLTFHDLVPSPRHFRWELSPLP